MIKCPILFFFKLFFDFHYHGNYILKNRMYSPRENKKNLLHGLLQAMATIFFWPKMWQGGDNEYMHWKACDT